MHIYARRYGMKIMVYFVVNNPKFKKQNQLLVKSKTDTLKLVVGHDDLGMRQNLPTPPLFFTENSDTLRPPTRHWPTFIVSGTKDRQKHSNHYIATK